MPCLAMNEQGSSSRAYTYAAAASRGAKQRAAAPAASG